ncbi:PqqD family protein [Thermodesulfobacteriota bacterium]
MTTAEENLSRIFIRENDIISRDIAGETILVPIRGNLADMQYIFTLNPVGIFIWEQLEGEKNLAEILESLLEHFETSREQAETDMLEFISQVTEAGLATEKP